MILLFASLLKRLFRKPPKITTYPYKISIEKDNKPYQEEIGALLDKIVEKEYDQLSQADKQKLLEASQSI